MLPEPRCGRWAPWARWGSPCSAVQGSRTVNVRSCVRGGNEWCPCVHCNTYGPLAVYLFVALQPFRNKLGMETKPLCTHQGGITERFPAAPLWAPRGTVLCVGTSLPTLLSPTPCHQPQRLLGTLHPMCPSPLARRRELGPSCSPGKSQRRQRSASASSPSHSRKLLLHICSACFPS